MRTYIFVLCISIILDKTFSYFNINIVNQIKKKENEYEMSMLERAKLHNHNILKYKLTTDDGYILTIF